MAVPSGTVQIKQGGGILKTVPVNPDGTYSASLVAGSDLSVGTDNIYAVYSGDSSFNSSSSGAIAEVVTTPPPKGDTVTSIGVSENPAMVGDTVVVSGVVSPA